MNTLSLSDLNTKVDAEPRILDVMLGERLGMAQPRNLRSKIAANLSELSTYGKVCTETVQTPRCKGGRPSRAFYLNEPQAILLCMFANTPLAAEVRHQVITVFMDYRKGGQARDTRPSGTTNEVVRLRTNIDRLERVIESMTGPRTNALRIVGEMLRRMEEEEANRAADFAMRIGAIRNVVAGEGRMAYDGFTPSRRTRYSEIIPALLEKGVRTRDIARKTGAHYKTIARYRQLA